MVCLVIFRHAFYSIKRIDILNDDRLVESLFIINMNINVEPVEILQGFFFELFLMFRCRDITECHEYRVTGMIVSFIKVPELLVTEVRDILRLATTVIVIGCCGVKVFTQGLP